MKIDLTLKITPATAADAQGNEKKALTGHLGTHFDVMDKEFPLEYTEREGIVFDCRGIKDRDIDIADVDASRIKEDMFVAFCTGFIEAEGYGTKRYFAEHPQLSRALIDMLLENGVSIIGVDFAGVRRGKEHPLTDMRCAEHGVFVVENLCGLGNVLAVGDTFRAHTYPVSFAGMTGLPCRVVADV